jgi:hypothetical protein
MVDQDVVDEKQKCKGALMISIGVWDESERNGLIVPFSNSSPESFWQKAPRSSWALIRRYVRKSKIPIRGDSRAVL